MNTRTTVVMFLVAGCATHADPVQPQPYAACGGISDVVAFGLCVARERMAHARSERDIVALDCEVDKIEKLEALQAFEPDGAQETIDRAHRAMDLARAARNCQGFIPVE